MASGSIGAAAAAEYWMELLRRDHAPSTIDALVEATESFDLTLDGAPYCTVLRPCFVEPRTITEAAAAATLVHGAIRISAMQLLAHDGLRRAVGFPAYLDAVLAIDRHNPRAPVRCRLDGLFDVDGCIRFLEFNTQLCGELYQFESSRALAAAPIARTFGARFPFTAADHRDLVVEALAAESRALGRPLPVRLGVIGSDASIPERWPQYAASRGGEVRFAEPDRIEVRDDAVLADGHAIDLVAVPFDELLAPAESMRPLLDGLRRGLVIAIYGVSQAIVCNSKLTFELLTAPEHAHLYDHDTQRALRRHVPWTRWVRECHTTFEDRRVDLLPFLAEHRERFVLKPAGSQAGEGVVLGWNCDAARWDATLHRAAAKRPYVAQERVTAVPEIYPRLVDGWMVEEPCTTDFNPLIWNGVRVEGFTARVGRDKHNVYAGASMGAAFILRDGSS